MYEMEQVSGNLFLAAHGSITNEGVVEVQVVPEECFHRQKYPIGLFRSHNLFHRSFEILYTHKNQYNNGHDIYLTLIIWARLHNRARVSRNTSN